MDPFNCMAPGHAAAVAASICVRKNIVPRDVDVKSIQDALRAEGVDFTMGGQDQKGLVSRG